MPGRSALGLQHEVGSRFGVLLVVQELQVDQHAEFRLCPRAHGSANFDRSLFWASWARRWAWTNDWAGLVTLSLHLVLGELVSNGGGPVSHGLRDC